MMISFAGVDEQTYLFSNLYANISTDCFIGICCYFPDFLAGFWFHHERGGGQVFVLVRSTFESGRAQTCGAICCIIFAFMGRLSATTGLCRNRSKADTHCDSVRATEGQLDIPYNSRHDASMNTVFLQRRYAP
jgi:hypothetical protein